MSDATSQCARTVTLIANDVGGLGGMGRQTARLVNGLIDRGWNITVIARSCAIVPRPQLRFIRVLGPRRPFPVAYIAFAVVATVQTMRCRRGVLHSTGAIVANRVEVSSVHYCHRASRLALRTPRAAGERWFYRLNAAVASRMAAAGEAWCYRPSRVGALCAVSIGVARELQDHFPRVASVARAVPNGVDSLEFKPDDGAKRETRKLLGVAPNVRLALFVGGDWQRKGLQHALDAMATADGWELVVAGEGNSDRLLAVAEAAGLRDRLHLLGRVKDMPRVYAAADAFVFPTAYEAFPLAMLEAAASGLPLLVTKVSGAEDLIADGINGWFIAPDPADIARRLNTLMQDPGLAVRLGQEARLAAQRFSWESMVDGYLDVYDELASADL